MKNKKVIKCFGESLGKTNQRITKDKYNNDTYGEQTENKYKTIEIKSEDNKNEDTFFNSMEEYDKTFPEYGFASNKGYGAQIHIEALKKYGPCPIHRRTFITHFV